MRESRTWRAVVDVGCLAIVAASLVGGICGTALFTAWTNLQAPEGLSISSLARIPVFSITFGVVISPIVAFGLALFGIPLTWLIGDKLTGRSGWLWALIASAASGTMFFTFILLLSGSLKLNLDWFLVYSAESIPFSVPTGMVWWTFIRRSVLGQQPSESIGA